MGTIIKTAHPLIGEFHLDNHDLNTKLQEYVRQEIRQDTGLDPNQKHSNIGGWHSKKDLDARLSDGSEGSNLLLLLLASFSDPITEYIRTHTKIFQTLPKDSYNWNYAGVWYNVAFNGSYNAPHVHPGAQISAAYYIRTEEPDQAHPFSGRIDFIENNIQYPFTPKAGTLLLFPSTMLHWVHPYYGKELRICLSFNAKDII